MKSLWNGFWLGVRTLVSDPIGYMTNPIGSVTEKYRKELESSGATEEVINAEINAFKSSGGTVYKIYDSARQGIKKLTDGLGFTFKYLPEIILVVLIGVGIYYGLKLTKTIKIGKVLS